MVSDDQNKLLNKSEHFEVIGIEKPEVSNVGQSSDFGIVERRSGIGEQ